jgi:hypothetical protein
MISWAKYSFLSQQSVMYVREKAGFLSSNRIYELVWDSENKELGALNHTINYLGNTILCIFRQPLKYVCFSYTFFDEGNVMYRPSIPPRKRYNGNDGASRLTGTALDKSWSVSFRDSGAAKISRVNCELCEEKSC